MTERRVKVVLDADNSPYDRSILGSAAKTRAFTRDLEQADSRLANMVQTGMALAPALTPISAAAVPAIAGLTSVLGFSVAAGGTAVLAFQGVGDALKALNEFQVDPTSKNLEKLNEKLDTLGPAGEVFVRQLQEMRPEVQKLQDVAQGELFPGMAEGLDELLELGPQAERVIGTLAGTMGDLFAEAGDNLNDPRWIEFFEYLDREGRPVLIATAKSVGNLVEGITNLVEAGDPMADDFLAGMLESSRDFVKWSDELDSTQGYENLLAYISENGPQAVDTLGALGGAAVSIVQATAPVGAVVLPILESLANIFADFMSTPAGPVIVATAAAIGTLGRSMALLTAVGLRGEGGGILATTLGTKEMKRDLPTIGQVGTTLYRAGQSAQFASKETLKAREAVHQFARSAGPAAGIAAGLGIATTGAADGLGLTNTAMLGLSGMMIGGAPGAAAGGLIGLFMDFTAGTDNSSDSLRAWSRLLDSGSSDVQAYADVLAQAQKQTEALAESRIPDSFRDQMLKSLTPGGIKTNLSALFGDLGDTELAKQYDASAKLQSNYADLELAINTVGRALGSLGVGEATQDLGELSEILSRAEPAMDALGISTEDLMQGARDGSILQMVAAIEAWLAHADTTEGRTEALAESFRGLDGEFIDTATSADALKNSLDALLSPGLNVAAATDAWRDGLRHLNDELETNNGSLYANTDAASQNRGVLQDRVAKLRDLLVAEAEAGAGSARLARLLTEGRKALMDAGEAAGLSGKELRNYLNDLGLTPKMVRTVIEAQVKNAERDVERVRDRLAKLHAMKPSPKVDAQIAQAEAKLKRLLGLIDAVKPKSVEIDVTTFYKEERIGGPRAKAASGGLIRGPGTTTSDSIPAMLSDKEYVHKAAAVEKYGVAMMEDINSLRFPRPQGYARGGLVGVAPGSGAGNNSEVLAVMQAAQAVRELMKSLQKDGKDRLKGTDRSIAEQELKVARDTLRDAQKGVGQAVRDKVAEKAAAAAQLQIDAAELQKEAADSAAQTADEELERVKQERAAAAASVASNALGGALDFTNLGTFDRSLTGQANNAAGFDKTLEALIAAGLDGALLEKVGSEGNVTFANQLLASGPTGIDYYEGLLAQADKDALSSGARVGTRNYGVTEETAQRIADETNARLDDANALIERLTAVTAASNEGAGVLFAAGINGVTKSVGQRQPKSQSKVGKWK